MATGFGFCPNCGAALTEAGQRFCAACGFTVPVSASAAAGAASVPAVVPPASAVVPPPPPSAPPPPPWAMQPVAPVGPTAPRTAVNPALLLVGALVIVAVAAAGVLAMNGSKASPSASAGHSGSLFGSAAPSHGTVAVATPTPRATPTPGGGAGSLKVQPAKFDCSDTTTQVTMTILLPAALEASAEVTAQLDGETGSTEVVSDNFKQQSDGRWLSTDTQSASDLCSAYGVGPHTFAVLDSDGKVLAKGSFSVTDEAAPTPTATPGASGGLIVVEPSTISCSTTTGDVSLSIWLPGSVSGSEEITAQTDVSKGDPEAVNVEFAKQSDGRWFLKDTLTVSNLCSSLDTGKHVLSVTDSHNTVLAAGAIDLEP
ncbi:MAG: zinc ribbon domain-containing protein [Candidatus Limnocylindrales bacterium]